MKNGGLLNRVALVPRVLPLTPNFSWVTGGVKKMGNRFNGLMVAFAKSTKPLKRFMNELAFSTQLKLSVNENSKLEL